MMMTPKFLPGETIYFQYPDRSEEWPATIRAVAHNFDLPGPVVYHKPDGTVDFEFSEIRLDDGSLVPRLYNNHGQQTFYYSVEFDLVELETTGQAQPTTLFTYLDGRGKLPAPIRFDVIKEHWITQERIDF